MKLKWEAEKSNTRLVGRSRVMIACEEYLTGCDIGMAEIEVPPEKHKEMHRAVGTVNASEFHGKPTGSVMLLNLGLRQMRDPNGRRLVVANIFFKADPNMLPIYDLSDWDFLNHCHQHEPSDPAWLVKKNPLDSETAAG